MQDRFAKKIYDQPSFQKLHLKFAALLQVQLQKNITYFLKVRHLEKKKKKEIVFIKSNLSELCSSTLPFR